jgi:type I restriction enzyme, R subunit
MSEYSYVEKPILEWLSGNPTDPSDKGLGWTYRTQKDLAIYGRDEIDALTEGILIPALRKINPGITDDNKAKKAVAALRAVMADPDPLSANRRTLDALRDGLPVVLAPGESATTVSFIAFDPARQGLNDFTVTNQYVVRGSKGTRADTVLLVNGIPLVVCEYKSILASGHDWPHGVKQVHRYQNEAPQLLVPNVFCVSADEHELRYGAVAYKVESEKDVEAQMAWWQPWLSQYPTTKCYWALPDEEKDEDGVRAAVQGLLSPTNVLSFLEAFVVFETRKGATIKKLARYQQFEAACDIVDRVLEGQYDSGLIWHTQGSGKSLTMLFTAYKLRRLADLKNPTVFIVVDRSDLKTQIADEFDDCDYPSVSKAMGVRDLKGKITSDSRETIVTTVQCFQQMDNLAPNTRHNIILLIDEAHRSQKGKEAGYAMTMRAKLPNAFRFGLTGTPIDRTMNNTHRNFGPVINGEQERYLSYYGIRQAIADGATLPVHYEMHVVPIKVDKEALNISFEQMCADMEVLDDEEKTELQAREARWKALVKDERRIQTVIEHMVSHFLTHPDPSGFKAQLVCVDREACALYKAALDKELERHGKPASWSEVVISPSQNDTDQLKRFHYDKSATEKIIERFKHRPDQEVAGEVPLKILIVCDRLLTGFDAPVEQVMYLDKPLRITTCFKPWRAPTAPCPR